VVKTRANRAEPWRLGELLHLPLTTPGGGASPGKGTTPAEDVWAVAVAAGVRCGEGMGTFLRASSRALALTCCRGRGRHARARTPAAPHLPHRGGGWAARFGDCVGGSSACWVELACGYRDDILQNCESRRGVRKHCGALWRAGCTPLLIFFLPGGTCGECLSAGRAPRRLVKHTENGVRRRGIFAACGAGEHLRAAFLPARLHPPLFLSFGRLK